MEARQQAHGVPSGERMLALCLLIVVAPALALIGLAVRARLGAPVLTRDRDGGLGGTSPGAAPVFRFRTGPTPAGRAGGGGMDSEEWRSWLGAVLSRWGLDLLPDLWSVVRGDVRLFGADPGS